MPRKYTEDQIKEIVESNNFRFISTYSQKRKNGSRRYVVVECENNHICETRLESIRTGHGCRKCYELIAGKHSCLDPEYVKKEIEKSGYILLDKYVNSRVQITVTCPNDHVYNTLWSTFKGGHRCLQCFNINQSGESSPNWKGGFRNLNEYIRKKLEPWKMESMKNCNYQCVITGGNFEVIHHLYSFNKILRETMIELGYPTLKNIGEYTDDQLNNIIEKSLEIHFRYPLGVCLSKKYHDLFHSMYGVEDNTPDQFYEFQNELENNFAKVVI